MEAKQTLWRPRWASTMKSDKKEHKRHDQGMWSHLGSGTNRQLPFSVIRISLYWQHFYIVYQVKQLEQWFLKLHLLEIWWKLQINMYINRVFCRVSKCSSPAQPLAQSQGCWPPSFCHCVCRCIAWGHCLTVGPVATRQSMVPDAIGDGKVHPVTVFYLIPWVHQKAFSRLGFCHQWGNGEVTVSRSGK